MKLFEEIRRDYEFGIGTIAGVGKKLGVHRRIVQAARNTEDASRIAETVTETV